MIPRMSMTVNYVDGATSTVEVKPRSQIAFERKFDLAIGQAFTGEIDFRFEHVYFLAWHASRASQEFDVWVELIDGINMEVGETLDPTPPVPSDGS